MTLYIFMSWIAIVTIVGFGMTKVLLNFGYKAIYINLLFTFVMPILFFPFAFSKKNIAAVGQNSYWAIFNDLPVSWLIFSSTYLAFFLSFFWTLRKNRSSALFINRILQSPLRRILGIRFLYVTVFAIEISLFVFLLMNDFEYGSALIAGISNPVLRPVINIWQVWATFSLLILLCSFYSRRSIETGVLALLSLVMSGLTGQRAVSLIPIFVVLFIALSFRGTKLSIKPVLLVAIALPLAIFMQEYRSEAGTGGRADNRNTFVENILYGNQFSEVRDFSWIKSHYNGDYLSGKTYISGYTSFIPSFVLEGRTRWNFGNWSARQAGLDTKRHPGLRGGAFAEVFFNFGYWVALAASVLTGFVFGRILLWEHNFATRSQKSNFVAVSLASYLASFFWLNIIISVNFFYVFVIMTFLLLVKILPIKNTKTKPPVSLVPSNS